MASIPDQQQQPPSQAAEADGEAGFGAAFAERSADPAGQAAKAQEDGDKPSNNEPADKAGSEQAPADKAATEQDGSGTKAPAFDPFAGMTPEQKAYVERLQASERSNRGRVGALTKKLNATTRAAPEAAPNTEKGQAKGNSEGAGADDTASDLDKKLQQTVDEYGDVVGPIAEVLAQVRSEIAALKKAPNDQAEVDADATAITEALGVLEKVHPDYVEVSSDANFRDWLGDQPQKVIDLANSYDPREVSLVLTLFKTERSAAQARSGQGDDPGKQDDTATGEKRKRQLEGSRQVPGKGQPTVSGVPNDFSSAFKARATVT